MIFFIKKIFYMYMDSVTKELGDRNYSSNHRIYGLIKKVLSLVHVHLMGNSLAILHMYIYIYTYSYLSQKCLLLPLVCMNIR